MSAVATRKLRGAVTKASAIPSHATSATSEGVHQPAWLSFDMRDRLLRGLSSSDAALRMLCMVFANEPQIDENKRDIAGLMGVVQYARRGLDALHIEITDAGADLDELYWAVYGAQSLVALLEELEWADGFGWAMADEFVCDYLTAAEDCIKQAIAYLKNCEVAR